AARRLAVRSHVGHRVQPPRAGNALELVLTPIEEPHAGPGDEILHGLRDEHLAAFRSGSGAGADHHREAGDLALVQLAFTGVHACPDLEAEPPDGVDDRGRAADRTRRAVEGRKEAVARGVLLLTTEAVELAPDERVVPLEQLTPGTIAHLCRLRARTDDVGEEDGGQHGVRDLRRRLTRDEALDLFRDLRGEQAAPVVGAARAQRGGLRTAARAVAGVRGAG